MEQGASERRGAALVGVILIVVGIAFLVAQQVDVQVGWPIWVVGPGIAFFLVGLVVGGRNGSGFAVAGGIITTAGAVLAIQDATGTYASWAYAWALVAPGGVGAGLLLYGVLTAQWDIARGGIGALVTGIALFLVGFLFFEGVLGLDGRPTGDLAKVIVPGALVLLGLLVIVGAFLPRRWWGGGSWSGAGGWGGGGWSGGGQSGGGWSAGSTAGTSGSAAQSGSAATSGGATGERFPESLAIDLGGAASAEVSIGFGAGRLAIGGPAAAGHLVEGTFTGGVRREDRGPGRVRLSTPGEAFWGRMLDGVPFDWRVGLGAEVPMTLILEIGAARTDADLSALRITGLRVKTGAAETDIVLPAAAGFTRVEAEGGAASLRIRVPPGVAARIRTSVALGSVDIDRARFPADPMGGFVSADYATAVNKAEIEIRGGVGSVVVR